MNDSTAEIIGYDRDELINIIKDNALALFHKDDVKSLQEVLSRGLKEGQLLIFEYRLLNKKNEYQWVCAHAKVSYGENQNHILLYTVMTDIDKLKKSEMEARMQREMFELALGESGFRFWEYDIKTKELYRSSVVQEEVGYDAYIQNVPEIFIEKKIIHPDYEKEYLSFYKKLQHGKDARLTFKSKYANGDYGWLDISYKVFFDNNGEPVKAVGIGGDISEQKKKEEEYQTTFSRMRDVCSYVVEQQYQDVFLINTKTGNMVRLFKKGGYIDAKRDENYSKVTIERLKPIYQGDLEWFKERICLESLIEALDGDEDRIRVYHYRKWVDDELQWCEYQFSYLRGNSDIILGLTKNINDQIKEEKKQQEKLKAALSDAKKANDAKSEFLSRMSHEIRTPMNAILGLANLGLDEKNMTKSIECFDKIHSSGKYLLGLINDILDMSRIESQRVVINEEVVAVADFDDQIQTIIRPLMDKKKIIYSYEKTGETKEYLKFDKLRVEQVLINILNNAIKFTKKGGHISYRVEGYKEGESTFWCKHTIEDDGVGMSKEFQKKLRPYQFR